MPEPFNSPLLSARSLTNSWDCSDTVIVYDSTRQRLSTGSKSVVGGKGQHLAKVKVPRWRNSVDLYVEIGAPEEKESAFVGTVNLGKLGWKVNWHRRRGQIEDLYVLEKVEDGSGRR